MFTFVLGTGAILVAPAYQSLVPDMVPRPQVPAAAALGSISVNLARAIGPAIAGLLGARIGVAAVFALNTATFLLYAVVVPPATVRVAAKARHPPACELEPVLTPTMPSWPRAALTL